MTRREMLKYGAVAGGAILISTKGPVPRSFASNPQSPSTPPFLDELPIPGTPSFTHTPFADLAPEAAPFVDPTGKKGMARFYTLVAEDRSVSFHKNLPPTAIWSYRDANVATSDTAFGPAFEEHISPNQFSGAIVRVQNRLKPDAQGFGIPRLTTHLHGGHQPARSDGLPTPVVFNGKVINPITEPGGHYDYTYPLLDPGSISSQPDIGDRPATQWYHDHIIDFTGANVYRGLVGSFLVFDAARTAPNCPDLGNELDHRGLQLPSQIWQTPPDDNGLGGVPLLENGKSVSYDIPIVIQDKTFAPDGSLVFDPLNSDGFLGDKFLVNGKIQPFFNAKRRRYRFRFLNGSGARIHQIFLTNSAGKPLPFTIIATEGGLLDHAMTAESFLLAPAERYEVIIDFNDSNMSGESEFYFENRLAQDEGRGPKGTFEQPETLAAGTRLMKINVGEKVRDDSLPVPAGRPLRPFAAITQAQLAKVTTIREFVFERSHGSWVINGELAGNLSVPMARPGMEQPEIWRLKNSSGGWWHPIHIHSEFQRVLTRNGGRPATFEQDGLARKDTTILGPGSEVEVYFNFRDFGGPFVFHCHNLAHEDMAMMTRFDVTPTPGISSL